MADLLCEGNHALKLWEKDRGFQFHYKEAAKKTVIEHYRCYMLYQFARRCSDMGDFAEVGVYKGGTARLIAGCTHKLVHLFDTFEGMPATDLEKDVHQQGEFADTSLEEVRKFLKSMPNVRFYKGKFPDTAPHGQNKYAFVHVDVDIYQSVKDCCRYFYPRLVPGGVIIFDDYGFWQCDGAKKAVDESFDSKDVIYLATGQAMVMKGDREMIPEPKQKRTSVKKLRIL